MLRLSYITYYLYSPYKCMCFLVDSVICTVVMVLFIGEGVSLWLHSCRAQIFVPHYGEEKECRVL